MGESAVLGNMLSGYSGRLREGGALGCAAEHGTPCAAGRAYGAAALQDMGLERKHERGVGRLIGEHAQRPFDPDARRESLARAAEHGTRGRIRIRVAAWGGWR
jgi:hypothetical protein